MQQFSLIHDPYAKLTPSQRLAVTAHNMRQARIAEQAKPDIAPSAAGFEIPNTPYGVPKIRRWQPVDEPATVYRVWFSIESEIDPQPRKISIKDIQRVVAMNVLDLFSGIGGFSLGLERAGMRTVAFCEIEPFPALSSPNIGPRPLL
jgi:hypothetical protein